MLTLTEIKKRLFNNEFPFRGSTEKGSASFIFQRPANYAGIALHAGSRVRPELKEALAVSPADRLREEDPGTHEFIHKFPIQIIAQDSRFEYDLNRRRDLAIYLTPSMTWGLDVWKRPLTEEEKEVSLAKYDEFHELMDIVAAYLIKDNNKAYIFDLHSYCYQRHERLPWYIDKKPVINLGTEAINQEYFQEDVKWLMDTLKTIRVDGRPIRVAANEVFTGGHLARRLCREHYNQLAVFAIEFKKVFMDEWSGNFYPDIFKELVDQFASSVGKWKVKR